MYQDETEKELEENGFRITSGSDDEDAEAPLEMPEDLPIFPDDEESDDPESRFH